MSVLLINDANTTTNTKGASFANNTLISEKNLVISLIKSMKCGLFFTCLKAKPEIKLAITTPGMKSLEIDLNMFFGMNTEINEIGEFPLAGCGIIP